MRIYLAGGAVRDLLLGRPFTDRDYLVTETTRAEFESAHPKAQLVGRAFPVYLVDGLEFSFPRSSHLTEELEARDLTVNALLLDENGELVCHPDGLADLQDRILRPASRESFMNDPLRVYRAARFWATFPDFTPHRSLLDIMREVAASGKLSSIAPDRVGQETVKATRAPSPGNYLRLLARADCLSPWFEELSEAVSIPAGPPAWHDTNVLEHTANIMDALAGDSIMVWMGLCHDIGKTLTPPQKHPAHHGHDKLGVDAALTLTRRLRLSNAFATAGAKASQWHMVAARYDTLRPGTRVDLLMDIHLSRVLAPLFKLVEADQGVDFLEIARHDLAKILSATLPPRHMNLGPESGRRLRELRAAALASGRKK